MKKVIVLRHGYRSGATALMGLADYLDRRVNAEINNRCYDWKKNVIRNGIDLAEYLQKKFPSRPVVLAGHSMGGLVCRVANIALACDNLASVMASHGKTWDYPPEDIDHAEKSGRRAAGAQPPEVLAVITLATPNSGAMTKAQTASLLNLGALWQGVSPGAVLGAAKALGG